MEYCSMRKSGCDWNSKKDFEKKIKNMLDGIGKVLYLISVPDKTKHKQATQNPLGYKQVTPKQHPRTLTSFIFLPSISRSCRHSHITENM